MPSRVGVKESALPRRRSTGGNAPFALPDPFTCNHSPEDYGNLKKSSARPGRKNERLMRWEGAVNERSGAGGHAGELELRSRSQSEDRRPTSQTAHPGRYQLKI